MVWCLDAIYGSTCKIDDGIATIDGVDPGSNCSTIPSLVRPITSNSFFQRRLRTGKDYYFRTGTTEFRCHRSSQETTPPGDNDSFIRDVHDVATVQIPTELFHSYAFQPRTAIEHSLLTVLYTVCDTFGFPKWTIPWKAAPERTSQACLSLDRKREVFRLSARPCKGRD
jgi:hypothetical protein